MLELLEDNDGAPYPEAVQKFVRALTLYLEPSVMESARLDLVDALESVRQGEPDDSGLDCSYPGCTYQPGHLGAHSSEEEPS